MSGRYAHRAFAWRKDPRPSTAVAAEEGCSDSLVRQARLGLIYQDQPWPKKLPTWERGPAPGSKGPCHIGSLNPAAVLTPAAVTWARRYRERHGTPYPELAIMVAERFNLRRVVTSEAVCAACTYRSWAHV